MATDFISASPTTPQTTAQLHTPPLNPVEIRPRVSPRLQLIPKPETVQLQPRVRRLPIRVPLRRGEMGTATGLTRRRKGATALAEGATVLTEGATAVVTPWNLDGWTGWFSNFRHQPQDSSVDGKPI